jgi:hypothetical protein
MDFLQAAFLIALLLCVAYGSLAGGRTGRAGSAIFVSASLLTAAGATLNPTWAGTSYAVLAVDSICLLALAALAVNSSRFWPIWAVGFQIVAVATHLATLWIPDIVPKAYQAILSFWSIPILWVMVAGTRKDRKYERDKTKTASATG